MYYRKLKTILVNHTERFKSIMSNKSQKKFNSILVDNNNYYRLLNGRYKKITEKNCLFK